MICRQRPGSAKGHVFISLEDETGIANLFVPGKTFEWYRLVITQEPFLRVRGRVQKAGPVVSVYVEEVAALGVVPAEGTRSHDFH